MKKFTFSGMATCTERFVFVVTVTPKDIAEFEATLYEPEFTLEDVEAWTDEQVRAYVEENMLEDRVREVEGYGDDVLIFSVFLLVKSRLFLYYGLMDLFVLLFIV